MGRLRGTPPSAARLFLVYAAVSLVVVTGIGLALASSYRSEATRRGVAEGVSESEIIATTAIEPLLAGRDLRQGLDAESVSKLQALADDPSVVTRLRIRDLDGRVAFSSDGSGLREAIEAAVTEAAEGHVEAELTRLNSDANDSGPVGVRVVEVYRPLKSGPDAKRLGVLEIYLPYDPIQQDIAEGLGNLYRRLAAGLAALYVVLAALCLVTTRRLRQQALRNAYLAEHDLLTGLPNRRVFRNRTAQLSAGGPGTSGAVALVDLDRFKEVNDSLGHHIGDQLLAQLGGRLARAVRPGDMVARLGGDEFGVILARVVNEAEAIAALERLRAELSEPLEINGLPLSAEASIGFVLSPDDGSDPETLMQRADIAMYIAKTEHTGVVRYDPSLDHYDPDRLAVVGELRRALSNGELVLHFQPKICLDDDSVPAVEALLRWHHPRHGLLAPDRFLPLAEQTGLIEPLTDWVICAALGQLRGWGDAAPSLAVSVNVSARNLCHPTFADRVLRQLRESGVAPERLVIEITETALLTDIARATATLVRLAAERIPISLDDFGQGQTSLGYLSRLPVHELKIDKGFVTDLRMDDAHAAIVRSVIELSHDLGFVVVAEGVEDNGTTEKLRDMGCDYAQGYAIARPMPADDALSWIVQQPKSSQNAIVLPT